MFYAFVTIILAVGTYLILILFFIIDFLTELIVINIDMLELSVKLRIAFS